MGEAEDGRRTVQLVESLKPDVVVLDIAMPNLNGIEAASQIVAKSPQTSVAVFRIC